MRGISGEEDRLLSTEKEPITYFASALVTNG